MKFDTTKFAFDCGTTNCAASLLGPNGPIPVSDEYGRNYFPATVSVKDGRYYVGKHGKTDIIADGSKVIHNNKRVLGRDKNDGSLMDDITKWNLWCQLGENGEAYYDIDGEKVSAVEVTALKFMHARKLIKEQFGEEPTECVVTVPGYFTNKQTQATKDAGRIAGLKIVRVISEPGAVAISALHSSAKNGNYLVFDVGGGTTDYAIVTVVVSKGRHDFTTVAAGGNNALGGEDCTQVLTNYFFKKVPNAMGRYEELRSLCEAAKNKNRDDDAIRILWDGKPFTCTQSQYTVALKPLLKKFETLLGLDSWHGSVDGVILAGGACGLRQIRELVAKKFKGLPSLPVGALSEAVARGAAWLLDGRQVTFMNGLRRSIGIDTQLPRGDNKMKEVQGSSGTAGGCIDSTGIGQSDGNVDGGIMEFIVRRNERLPTSDSILVPATSHQSRIHLYEGDHNESTKNISLGLFWLMAPEEWFNEKVNAEEVPWLDLEVSVTSDMEIKIAATAIDGPSESLVVKREDNSDILEDVITKLKTLTLQRSASGERKAPQKKRKRKRR